ncbi:MAG: bifunctional nuclease family protein [Bacteroidia bacterium]
MDKIELKILGISSGHTNASYTLILEEIKGERKLPVVIGSAEAQSIAVQIEGIKPIRPMTHDLMKSLLSGFNIELKEIVISKLEEGIFYADVIAFDGEKEVKIDARTSDAIAMALRYGCPIYTFENILKEAGIILSEQESEQLTGENALDEEDEDQLEEDLEELIEGFDQEDDLEDFSMPELEKMLDDAINEENYDLAAKIRDIINSRK